MKKPLRRFLACLSGAVVVLLLCACTSPAPVSPAVMLAQASTQRGAQSFARGDLPGAQREYTTALRIYESLGDTPQRASSLLSLARVAAQDGRTDDALSLVNQILADKAQLTSTTVITAYGRASALHLMRDDLIKAGQQLDQASAICAATCADTGALMVLRARLALAQQQPALALKLTSDALALPALAFVVPPTLHAQASAERANALRVQAQAQSELGQHSAAVVAANASLELDKSLGLADRVMLDLQLLASAHGALGNAVLARQYQTLAERALSASNALRGQAQTTLPAN